VIEAQRIARAVIRSANGFAHCRPRSDYGGGENSAARRSIRAEKANTLTSRAARHNELHIATGSDQKAARDFLGLSRGADFTGRPDSGGHLAALLFSAASTGALFFLALRFMNRFWAVSGRSAVAFFRPIHSRRGRRPTRKSSCCSRSSFLNRVSEIDRQAAQRVVDARMRALSGVAIAFKQSRP